MPRIILHADMDCFFAAVEIREDPALKGKPVIIGAKPGGRGVVCTCSMEARKLGVHSAMPISRAFRLCPDGVYLRPNFSLYVRSSRNIMAVLQSHADAFQQMSIDEAFLDVTERVRDFAEAEALARRIKQEILEREGLTCSIGIAVNKTLAKIASDHQKPDGLTVVHDGFAFLDPLPIRKLPGIGPKMEVKLKALGMHTIGDIARYDLEILMGRFGVYGAYLHRKAHGLGSDVVEEEDGRSSISKERTFFRDEDRAEEVMRVIDRLSASIADKLHRESYFYRTVGIKVRLHDFTTFTRAATVGLHSGSETIARGAKGLFQEFAGKKIRLIGVRVSNLELLEGQRTLSAFADQPCEVALQ